MEENRAAQLLFLWEKISEGEIRLLRVFGEQPVVTVSLVGSEMCIRDSLETIERDGKLHELSEKYIKEVQLPADIVKIGSCAFYNCTKMERISVYPKLVEVGSDAFMNCLNLRSLRMCAGVEEPTGLKQLLAQIKWQVEVSFEQEDGEREAVLMYPEYYESYDEIGPAQIFELNLTGEGFRARQCFKEGVILLNAYDEIFPQACVEESAEVLIPMVWNRLYTACGLSPEARAD